MEAIVLVGHGTLPEALKGSVGMIAGEREDILTVSLAPEDGPEDLERKLAELDGRLAEADRIQVFADLFGGSPCNAALKRYADDERVSIISGANLPMVVTAAIQGADARELIAEGRAGIRDVKAAARGEEEEAPAVLAPSASTAPTSGEPQQVVGVRVDARGIHGQVATVWVPRLDVTRIVVVDSLAVRDETQKTALKMAKPASVKLSILTPEKAVERLRNEHSYPGDRIFVVLPRVVTLGELDELGYDFDVVNMGNVPNRPDTTAYAKTVHLTADEAKVVRDVAAKGTRFTQRQVPADPENDFVQALDR